MPLKKGGDRIIVNLSIKKETDELLTTIAEKENRPKGRMFDVIVEDYAARKEEAEREKAGRKRVN